MSTGSADFSTKPTLVGEDVLLRPFRVEDMDPLWEMLHEPEGIRLTGSRATFSREVTEQWYRSRNVQPDRLDLAIVNRASEACIGEVVLNDYDSDNECCNFRISLLGPSVYGKGYGTAATELMLGYAFGDLGLHRVELEVYSFNPRAARAYEKAGFVAEGTRRESLHWEGQWYDTVIMGAISSEWLERSSSGAHDR
jgi:RimJ/RimL family protein N-acetyltransferase